MLIAGEWHWCRVYGRTWGRNGSPRVRANRQHRRLLHRGYASRRHERLGLRIEAVPAEAADIAARNGVLTLRIVWIRIRGELAICIRDAWLGWDRS